MLRKDFKRKGYIRKHFRENILSKKYFLGNDFAGKKIVRLHRRTMICELRTGSAFDMGRVVN